MVVMLTAAAVSGAVAWAPLPSAAWAPPPSAARAGAGVPTLGAVVAVVAVVAVTAGFGGAGFFASSGKSLGATAAHNHSRPIEIRTAAKIRFSMSGDGVPTSRIERMAARQTSHAHPDAAERAIFFDRLQHVDRAGRLEAAHRREQRRDEPLVETQECQNDGAHHSSSGRALLRELLQRALQVVAELFEARLGGVRLDIDDDVQRVAVERERLALAAVDLASPAFESIANGCFSEFLRRGDADSGERESVGSGEDHTIAGEPLAAGLIYVKKLASFRQSLLFGETFGPRLHAYTARRLRPFRRRRDRTA